MNQKLDDSPSCFVECNYTTFQGGYLYNKQSLPTPEVFSQHRLLICLIWEKSQAHICTNVINAGSIQHPWQYYSLYLVHLTGRPVQLGQRRLHRKSLSLPFAPSNSNFRLLIYISEAISEALSITHYNVDIIDIYGWYLPRHDIFWSTTVPETASWTESSWPMSTAYLGLNSSTATQLSLRPWHLNTYCVSRK